MKHRRWLEDEAGHHDPYDRAPHLEQIRLAGWNRTMAWEEGQAQEEGADEAVMHDEARRAEEARVLRAKRWARVLANYDRVKG